MTQKEFFTRREAAAALGVSVRTVDRLIPPGTKGRTSYSFTAGKVLIARHLVEALLPGPGGGPPGDQRPCCGVALAEDEHAYGCPGENRDV